MAAHQGNAGDGAVIPAPPCDVGLPLHGTEPRVITVQT
jgi:hypothetical protein